MSIAAHMLACGDGWHVQDVICSHGPRDRVFEERHVCVSIAAVTAGTFQYRTQTGAATLAPGALLLGNHGACYECGHAHGVGDRCIAFHLEPHVLESVAAALPGQRRAGFSRPSLPPRPKLVPLLAEAEAAREDRDADAFDELALRFAAATLVLDAGEPVRNENLSARDEKRISGALRRIEAEPQAPHSLAGLARDAGMSRYHFLRVFRRVAGLTPHQYVLRLRLHRAALRLRFDTASITAVAYESGFNDLSTFNRRFRRFMGMTPGAWQAWR
jgi:AraC-like DNA-binding protein